MVLEVAVIKTIIQSAPLGYFFNDVADRSLLGLGSDLAGLSHKVLT
jgi:hypothetical protein